MARHLTLPDRGREVLALIREVPRSGKDLLSLLGVTPAELALIVHPLWHARLLQGEPTDACRELDDFDGSSRRLDQRWRLSNRGTSALDGRARTSAATFFHHIFGD